MNVEKINLIIKNMELLIESLKLEIKEDEKSKYAINLEEFLSIGQKEDLIDTYEPNYYEEP